uniref:Zona pellucida protein AX 2 n=1 Tax=Cyprinus carpio TaxID=7962 RepID=A0A8C1Y8R3_CYPCA
NRVQFTLPSSLSAGSHLEVYAVNNTHTVFLTPHLAAQCGYTQKLDPWGNTIVSASLQSCFAENQGDKVFKVAMQFKLYEITTLSEKVHEVFKTCSHTMISREILCEKNFMEASNFTYFRLDPTDIPNLQLWKILLYTPGEKAFQKDTLQAMGYSVYTSPTRLVMRSPFGMAENFIQNVNNVDMIVFKSVVLFRDRWIMTLVESAAACPINGASVEGQMIYWHVPLHITPLVSSEVEILEVHLGVNGRRFTLEEMVNRNYVMTITDSHIIVEIPIGAAYGNYKSHVLNEQYHVSYNIEPVLELLWKEGLDMTSYKVLFPITTPLTSSQLQVKDYTQPKQKVFDVLLGYFLPDVELLNITFVSELLTVSEIINKGILLQEHSFSNDTKAFTLQVPFSDPQVQIKNFRLDVTTYTLPLVFGFAIMPEHTTFAHSIVLEASLADIVLPQAEGSCNEDYFNMYVQYGTTPSSQIKIKLGHMELNNTILQQYQYHSNETHFDIIVPFLSPVVAFELAGIMGRLDVEMYDSLNNWSFREFSLACPFFVKMSECFPNGTITAIIPKLESVPHLQPGELSLRDPACKPYDIEDYFAYFHFNVTSCGTTRKEPYADVGKGELTVSLRLSKDMVYRLFYHDGDFPVVKFLKQPLYFEVGMNQSRDSRIAVVLENCWATLTEDRESKPRWDLIVDGCASPKDPEQTIILPVVADERVDIPDHFKRFEVKTFTFTEDDESSERENVFVHCDVAICHAENTADGRCYKKCEAAQNLIGSSSNRGNYFNSIR